MLHLIENYLNQLHFYIDTKAKNLCDFGALQQITKKRRPRNKIKISQDQDQMEANIFKLQLIQNMNSSHISERSRHASSLNYTFDGMASMPS